jgi:hypothetical protein
VVISYSLTGNNEDLAKNLAKKMAAEHVSIAEPKPRTMGTIVSDIVFGRTPKIRMPEMMAKEYDLVVFVGPVWMGQVATPFRACFKQLRPKVGTYAFASISGGADGPNPKLADELKKRLGKEPVAVIDLHIADLLSPEPKPTRKDTSAYRVNEKDVKHLTDMIEAALNTTIAST